MAISLEITPVTFQTASPVTLKDVPTAARRPVTGQGTLYRPAPNAAEGGRPRRRPAVIVSPGLGGVKGAREHAYGRRLAEHGYVALVVDYFTARGRRDDSHSRRALAVTESTLLFDTYAAFRLLAARPDVDPAAIGIIGFSYGGMIAGLTAYEQINRLFLDDTACAGHRFAAHVGFYGCSVPRMEDPTTTGAPVLMVVGALDRNVSIPRTCAIVDDLRRGGSEARVVELPGVYHQWDSDDATPRFVRWAIDRVRMRVQRDNTIRDEITGITVRGIVSRGIAITAGATPRGYTIKMDAEATQTAVDLAFGHFDRAFGWTPEEGARTTTGAAGRGAAGATMTRAPAARP